MAKDKISDYSSTANSNTDIAGINIDEGCAPSGINDAIRTLMAQLKTWQSGGQDVYIHPAGSASAPSITANGDTNTGIFFPAADTVGISTGGTERARVDSSGNLGLGVTPSAWSTFKGLQFVGGSLMSFSNAYADLFQNTYFDGSNLRYVNTGFASYYRQTSGVHSWSTAASGSAGGVATFTQAMTLDASGNLLVGDTTADYSQSGRGVIEVNGSSTSLMALKAGGTPQSYWYYDGANVDFYAVNGALRFGAAGSERARIDTSGNLLVGKTTTSATSGAGVQFQPSGYVNAVTASSTSAFSTYELYSTGAGAYRFFVGANGQVYATITTISSLSDQRFKENIRDLDAGLDKIMALKPRLYDWKEGKGADIKNARGFIAQEFEEVFPDLIDEWRDPAPEGEEPYKSVRQDLIPVLVKAIQELKATVDAQAARITALEQA